MMEELVDLTFVVRSGFKDEALDVEKYFTSKENVHKES